MPEIAGKKCPTPGATEDVPDEFVIEYSQDDRIRF